MIDEMNAETSNAPDPAPPQEPPRGGLFGGCRPARGVDAGTDIGIDIGAGFCVVVAGRHVGELADQVSARAARDVRCPGRRRSHRPVGRRAQVRLPGRAGGKAGLHRGHRDPLTVRR